MPVELRSCGHELSSDHGAVVYKFELWKIQQRADGERMSAKRIHQFGARYSALKAMHAVLSARQPAPPKFPSQYILRNMVSDMANRELRASELLAYLRAALLSDASVWEEEVIWATLGFDRLSAAVVAATMRSTPLSHPDVPTPALRSAPPPKTARQQGTQDPGPLPVHLCGRYVHDDRSDDWEPVLEAMGLPWIVRKVGRYLNPDVELYFTQTHFNVWGSTALGPNTDSFPLSGKEERLADMSEGSPVEEPMSYMCQTDGRTIKTWTWIWHADGKSKKWLTTSERCLEGSEPPSLSSPSFHERVTFFILDEPDRPPIHLNRYMVRDTRHPPQFPLPPEIASRAWRPAEAKLQPQPQPQLQPQADCAAPLTAVSSHGLRHRNVQSRDVAPVVVDDSSAVAKNQTRIRRFECSCNADSSAYLYVLRQISRHLVAAAVGATVASIASAVVRAYSSYGAFTT